LKGIATKGKSTIGWFFGFKPHLVINDKGEVIKFPITPVNVEDREPLKNKKFHDKSFGKLFADKGYISQSLFEQLFVNDIHLITKLKKNICLIEHTWHRAFANFIENLLAGLITYSVALKKPSLSLEFIDIDKVRLLA
jgi:hypothetical protein